MEVTGELTFSWLVSSSCLANIYFYIYKSLMCTWGVWWHVCSRVGTLFFVSLFKFMIYFEVLSNVDMWVEVTCELTFNYWPNTKFNYSNRHKRWKRWESPIVWVQRFLCTIAIMGSNSPQDPRCELDWGNMQMPSYGFLLQLPLLVLVWAIWQKKLDL